MERAFMTKFIIKDEVWTLFPHAKIGVVICHGIDNSKRDVELFEKLLDCGSFFLNKNNITGSCLIRRLYEKFISNRAYTQELLPKNT